MFFRNKILLLFAVAALLSGCVQKGETSNSSESPQFSSTEDSLVSSVSESSISESKSLESQSESSSDDKVYYTVSIYQSYPNGPDALGRKDTRLDKKLKIKSGDPLYTDTVGMRALKDSLNPQYTPLGGYYYLSLLYRDEECTLRYKCEPIDSDSAFYYYMGG